MRAICACLLLLFLAAEARAEEPRSVLGRFVGRWTFQVDVDRRQPPSGHARNQGTAHSEWILNDRYVAFWSEAKSGERELQLITWDEKRRLFRSWLYESDGVGFDVEGTWDDATATLHWKDAHGRVDIADRFENGDLVWTLERRDEKGKTVYVVHGRCRRLPAGAQP